MTATAQADVLVIGLGPAGASAAAEAARRGCRVIAVDRKREPGRPVQCAEFVPAMIGVEIDGLAASVRQAIQGMATIVEDDAPHVKDRFPGHMLDRAAFDAALVAKAVQAGACCRPGTSVRHISPHGRAELSDGTALDPRVLVGADGPRSLAGRAIGSVNSEVVEARQITVALRQSQAATVIFLSAGIPGGYGWLFPKGDVAHLGAGIDPVHRTGLKTIVARLHHSLTAEGRVGPQIHALTGGLIPCGGMLQPWGRLGAALVLLAGDAAGLANPVTGAGIVAAVQSGRFAGQAAAASVAGVRAAGDEYEAELENLFRPSLGRALRRRRELAAICQSGSAPGRAALRRGWIAYPEYWAA